MAEDREKRSSQPGATVHELAAVPGVGGRRPDRAPAAGGGGYQGNRGGPHVASGPEPADRDPRLAELERMGLRAIHIRVAEEIGVDAFLAMWRIYDGEQAFHADDSTLMVPMRLFSSYQRFQRNRFIETLHAAGVSRGDIRRQVRALLGEDLHPDHISRLARRRYHR